MVNNMKKMKLSQLVLLALSIGSIALIDQLASADQTEGTISFVAGTGVTDPLDPTDPDNPSPTTDPDNGPTGNSGPLSLDSVPNIRFGSQERSSSIQFINAQNKVPFTQVTDNRGTGEGWELKAKISPFTSPSGDQLEGARLAFSNGLLKTQSTNTSAPPEFSNVVLSPEYKTFTAAEAGKGKGTWLTTFEGEEGNNSNIKLQVYPGTADENAEYKAMITWELSTAP